MGRVLPCLAHQRLFCGCLSLIYRRGLYKGGQQWRGHRVPRAAFFEVEIWWENVAGWKLHGTWALLPRQGFLLCSRAESQLSRSSRDESLDVWLAVRKGSPFPPWGSPEAASLEPFHTWLLAAGERPGPPDPPRPVSALGKGKLALGEEAALSGLGTTFIGEVGHNCLLQDGQPLLLVPLSGHRPTP